MRNFAFIFVLALAAVAVWATQSTSLAYRAAMSDCPDAESVCNAAWSPLCGDPWAPASECEECWEHCVDTCTDVAFDCDQDFWWGIDCGQCCNDKYFECRGE